MYALCLDYKTEQAHIDYILRTRRLPAVSGAVPAARRLQRLAPRAGRDRARRAGRRRAAVRRRRAGDRAVDAVAGRGAARRAASLLLGLRVLGVLACLVTALQPTIELRQVTRAAQPRGGAGRRARARWRCGRPTADRRAPSGRRRCSSARRRGSPPGSRPATRSTSTASARTSRPRPTASLREPPAGDATRIGEALGDVRARYAGRDLGAVVVISDGIDTGRIGEGPLDAATRTAIEALGAPVHTVGLGEKSLRDLSVAAVLADQFAFVRTPASIEAVIRQTGLARPAGRGDAGARRPPDRHPRRRAARRSLRGEDRVRLAARSPGQLRVPHLDARARGRGAARATTSSRSR